MSTNSLEITAHDRVMAESHAHRSAHVTFRTNPTGARVPVYVDTFRDWTLDGCEIVSATNESGEDTVHLVAVPAGLYGLHPRMETSGVSVYALRETSWSDEPAQDVYIVEPRQVGK